MPKECGSWRGSRAQACHPPPGPAHPLHYQLTQSLPPGRLLSPRPHSCCVELARRAHADTGLNRPMRPECSDVISIRWLCHHGRQEKRKKERMCCILVWPTQRVSLQVFVGWSDVWGRLSKYIPTNNTDPQQTRKKYLIQKILQWSRFTSDVLSRHVFKFKDLKGKSGYILYF